MLNYAFWPPWDYVNRLGSKVSSSSVATKDYLEQAKKMKGRMKFEIEKIVENKNLSGLTQQWTGTSPTASDTNITHGGRSVSREEHWCVIFFLFSLLFVCSSLLPFLAAFILSSPLQSNQSGTPPSQHPSTAQSCFPPHLPHVWSPLFYLCVLPASFSISSSRGTGPALWLTMEIPPWGTVWLTPGWLPWWSSDCVCVCLCACVRERKGDSMSRG